MNLDLLALWLIRLLALYAGAGLLFALLFVTRGVDRLDRAAAGSTWGFRMVILPGVVALWPMLVRRWYAGEGGPPVERTAHRAAGVNGSGRDR